MRRLTISTLSGTVTYEELGLKTVKSAPNAGKSHET